ncbi:type II toxin-antitoxin system prevent-host-death family antitoxin [Ornithinibacter aureus]|uniref:Antitoxin n=1 Tax=Ornithinibacter aureus TaxID=622664 RepID=A0ABP8K5A5_9MICO|nr:type II toxin-antitoxin system prevent-host-death family antitoxin [Ornithinibacter aureus]KAF0834873.1 prevent-host-death family protein [Ornithinibacter aureus]
MTTVKVQYAKTHLSALLAAVEQGDEVVIARGDQPVARLVPARPRGERELGFIDYQVPAEFFADLPGVEIQAWEGEA